MTPAGKPASADLRNLHRLNSALSAISGWLTDRMGPRPVVAVGAVLLTSGYLLWATASNIVVVAIGMAIVAPLGMSCSWVPCNATVVRWFVVRRGFATAIATAGGSLANILVPPIAAVLVSAYGWRVAILVMSLTGGICMLLSSIVLERDPEREANKQMVELSQLLAQLKISKRNDAR